MKGTPAAYVLGGYSVLCFTWTILTPAISAVTNKTAAAKLYDIYMLYIYSKLVYISRYKTAWKFRVGMVQSLSN